MLNRITGSLIVLGAVVFVLLLAGVGEGMFTDDPPAQSRYESGPGGAESPTTAPEAETPQPESTGTPTFAITEVAFGSDGFVTITNVGDGAGSFSGFLCQRPSYADVSTPSLQPGESHRIPASGGAFGSLSADDGEMGLYRDSNFGSSDSIISYVEWGSSGHGRASVAVGAGIWADGAFVDSGGAAMISNATGSANADDWGA